MRTSISIAFVLLISCSLTIAKYYIDIHSQLSIYLHWVNGREFLLNLSHSINIDKMNQGPLFDDSQEIERETAGARVVPVLRKYNGKNNKSDIHYESYDMIEKIENIDENDWSIYDIDDNRIQEYLLEDEIKSSKRDSQGNTLAGSNCHVNNPCCLSSNALFFLRNHPSLKANTERTHQLWTWFRPPHNRSLFNVVDAFDLIIDDFEKKNISKQIRSEAHVVFIGDSLTHQTYTGFICSLQRTLGARVVLNAYRVFSGQESFKIQASSLRFYMPAREQQVIIHINSTSKGKGIRSIKFTFINQYRPFFESINRTYTGAILKTICGIPFKSWNANGDKMIEIKPKKDNVDVILLNHGAHHLKIKEYAEIMNVTLNTFAECQKAGVHTIFRDTYAQHFRYDYGGEYNSLHYKGKAVKNKELPQRTMALSNTTYCAPNIYLNKSDINWRYRMFQDRYDVLDLSNNTICHRDDPNKFDFIPGYATTNYYWKAHLVGDCTHYAYSPGLYLPIIDGFYKAIFRSTLEPGECKSLPDNSNSPFISGPIGLKIGTLENHNNNFLPVVDAKMPTIPRLRKAATVLDPITN